MKDILSQSLFLLDHQEYSLVPSNRVEAVGMMSADGTVDSDDECILQPNSTRSHHDWNVILWLDWEQENILWLSGMTADLWEVFFMIVISYK